VSNTDGRIHKGCLWVDAYNFCLICFKAYIHVALCVDLKLYSVVKCFLKPFMNLALAFFPKTQHQTDLMSSIYPEQSGFVDEGCGVKCLTARGFVFAHHFIGEEPSKWTTNTGVNHPCVETCWKWSSRITVWFILATNILQITGIGMWNWQTFLIFFRMVKYMLLLDLILYKRHYKIVAGWKNLGLNTRSRSLSTWITKV
jgi:hypothetical protein